MKAPGFEDVKGETAIGISLPIRFPNCHNCVAGSMYFEQYVQGFDVSSTIEDAYSEAPPFKKISIFI